MYPESAERPTPADLLRQILFGYLGASRVVGWPGADVYNLGKLYVDSTSINMLGIDDGNQPIPI